MDSNIRLYDKNQRPIYPGDLIRTFHFLGGRRKKHYLYHVVVATTDGYDMVPVSHLEPTKAVYGGRCRLDKARAREVEIIYGNGPPPFLSFEDRPRRQGKAIK